MSPACFVTGAQGCIGAWVVKALVERGERAVVYDLAAEPRRLALLLDEDRLGAVEFVRGDITDYAALRGALERSGARRIIHLAALQVPFCKADPRLGAAVNVVGTVNVFEAARELGVPRLAYASSAAVYGPATGAVDESVEPAPTTLYGVYKRANEGTARVYHDDHGIHSVGLRPLTVYGVARDQGMTSDVTRAMKAAVLGRPFTIRFGGATDLLYAADAADAFLACAERGPDGAHVFNLHGDSIAIDAVVAQIGREVGTPVDLRVDGPPLPIPPAMDDHAIRAAVPGLLRTPLDAGVRETISRFTTLHRAGRLGTEDLDA